MTIDGNDGDDDDGDNGDDDDVMVLVIVSMTLGTTATTTMPFGLCWGLHGRFLGPLRPPRVGYGAFEARVEM